MTLAFGETKRAGHGGRRGDIEAGELRVLQNAEEILLELHAFACPMFDTDAGALRRLLDAARYEILDIEPPHRPLDNFPDYGHALVRPL